MTPSRAFPYDVVIAAPNSALDSYYPVPALVVGEVNRASAAYHTAGGKGFNMGRAAVCLGGRPLCVGIVGGNSGRFLAGELEREGIPADLVWTDRGTRRTATMTVATRRESTGVIEPGVPAGNTARVEFAAAVRRHAADAPYVTLTGSLPPDFPPDFFAVLVADLKASAAAVAVDASGAVLRHAALAGPAILKVNVEELDSAFPDVSAGSVLARGRAVLGELEPRGLALLALTDGDRGAYVFARDREPLHVVTPLESWACPAGAGDSFLAGLLLALGNRLPLEEAAARASAAAAASIHHIVSGQIERALFDRLLARTVVRRAVEEGER